MKKFFTYFFALAALFSVAVSCNDEDDYKPAEPVSGPQVFFSADIVLNITVMEDEPWFEVALYRGDTEGSVSFSFDKSGDANKFDIPDVSFVSGESETSITIGYDPEDFPEYGDYYVFTLAIPDGYNTPYGVPEATFTVTKEEPWKSLGYAEFCDWFFFYNENEDTSLGGYMVELQQNELYPERFRLIDPYVEGLANPEEGYDINAPTDNNLNFRILKPDDTLAGITITMEDLVYFEPINPGWFYDYYGAYIWLYHPAHFDDWQTEDEWTHTCVLSYQDDGETPAIVQLAPVYYLPGVGYYDYHNYDEMVWIIFPGVEVEEPADYSVGVEYAGKYTDADDNESILANVTMGADVEFTAVVMTEGSDPTAALYGILLDTIEYQTVTEDCTVTFDAPTETGYYTILAVSYGDEDYQYYDWDTFFYSTGGGDVDPWVVETTGDYAFSGFYYDGTDTGLILYSNSYDDTLYKIADWGAGVDFTFNWDKDTNELYVQDQQTGDAYGSYGDVYVCDLSDYFPGIIAYSTPSYYDDGVFYFGVAYYCSGGGFGYGYESFKTKGSSLGTAVEDIAGTFTGYAYSGYYGSLYYADYVIEESDDPTLGNIMFTTFDDTECDISGIYGTYDEETGVAEFELDQLFGTYQYMFWTYQFSFTTYYGYPAKFLFFKNGDFWGPFYGDLIVEEMYYNGDYDGDWDAYQFMYGVKEDAEPNSIKPASASDKLQMHPAEPAKDKELKANINFTKKPVKNSAVKPASVAPVEQQKTGCQPVKKDAKKVVPPTPGTPTPVTK